MAAMLRDRVAWRNIVEEACAAMASADRRLRWTSANTLPDMGHGDANRRGTYRNATEGLSFGNGQGVSHSFIITKGFADDSDRNRKS